MISPPIHRSRLSEVRTAAALLALVFLTGCTLLQANEPRIVAIGDFHGDYGAFEKVLTRANLMNDDGDWSGGKSIVVQVGDIADRGPDTRKIVAHLKKLQEQAEASGGQIIALVGNHEAMVMTGDIRYVHPGEYEAFVTSDSEAAQQAFFEEVEDDFVAWVRQQNADATEEEIEDWFYREVAPLGRAEHRLAWRPSGEIGSWVVKNSAILKLGESLFVHGGISAKYSDMTIEEINAAAKEALSEQITDRGAIIHDPLGPLWYRGLLREPCEVAETGVDGASLTIEEELDVVLTHFGVERIVVGHTPSLQGIKANHNGRVIQIDTGMSAHYGGINSFLEITEEGVFANNDGVVVRIDNPSETASAEACQAGVMPSR